MSTTKIEWATDTINPIVGCSKCSPGCDHCYAERMAGRLAAMGHLSYEEVVVHVPSGVVGKLPLARWNGRTVWVDGVIERALKTLTNPRSKPRRIFWESMSDPFHPATPFEWIDRIMAVAALTPRHQHIMLTKRGQRMLDYWTTTNRQSYIVTEMRRLADRTDIWIRSGDVGEPWPLPNLCGMVTCCNQEEVDRNIPILLDTPMAMRGVSLEPLLGPVTLYSGPVYEQGGRDYLTDLGRAGGPVIQRGLDWVILGGETGPGARPMNPAWARKVRDDCQAAGVPFFFKGFGGWSPVAAYSYTADDVGPRDVAVAPDGRIFTQSDSTLATGVPPVRSWTMRPARTTCRLLDGRERNELPEVHA